MPRPQKQSAIIKPQEAANPSLLTTVKEGFSFGVGSAIAHRLMGSIFSFTESNVTSVVESREYQQCLAEHNDFADSSAICADLLRK